MLNLVSKGAKAYSSLKSRNKKSETDGSFFGAIKRNWYVVLLLFLAYPFIVSYMRRQEAKDKVRASEDELKALEVITANPRLLNEELNKITTDKALHTVATELFHHLGYAYPLYDPRRWSENDEAIFLLLNQFSEVPYELIQLYFVVSKGRHLRTDCLKVLDDKYYKQLNW